jgi:hypothetical protein
VSRRSQARRRALLAAHGRCPRCSAAREATQRYCLECGLALPALDGRLATLRAAWIRRLGWYPGDFVWVTLAAGLIAAAAAAASIAVESSRAGGARRTVVAPVPVAVTPAPVAEPDGRTRWPPGQTGWTVVIQSLPASAGVRPASHLAAAAAAAGLPEVGVLASSRYPSLLPGYDVVFSGVYLSEAQAAGALRTVLTRGYAGAYTAEIAS